MKIVAWAIISPFIPVIPVFLIFVTALFLVLAPILITVIWVVGQTIDKSLEDTFSNIAKFYFLNYVLMGWSWARWPRSRRRTEADPRNGV